MLQDTPYSAISCIANVFIKQMHFLKAGDKESGHAHCFDHTTLLAKGSLDVLCNGKTTRFTAPQMIFIKADTLHELVAAEDGTVAFCIHALRNGEKVEDILDPAGIPDGTNPQTLANSLIRLA